MLSLPLLKKWIAWNVGLGSIFLIGLDPSVGSGAHYRISSGLLRHLHSLNVFFLVHIIHCSSLNSLGSIDWLLPNDLGLEGDMDFEWESYLSFLRHNGIFLNNEHDIIIWTWDKTTCDVTVKSTYTTLVDIHVEEEPEWWFRAIWKP
jgi:hypothetical protein